MSEFAGKRVLVVGLGVSGFAAARALAKLDAKVSVTEQGSNRTIEERAALLTAEGVDVDTGAHDLDALDADVAVLSPGIPPDAPIVRALRAAGAETIGEVELAYRLARCDFLAVTGTNGKTTTTSLLGRILAEAGIPSCVGGNIGVPLIDAVASLPKRGAVAVELSSFQLASILRFRPRVAVLLNIAEDHTDWHGSPEAYAAAKARIIENQTPDDVFVFNADDARAVQLARIAAARVVPFSAARAQPEGVGVSRRNVSAFGKPMFSIEDVLLPGMAGLEDACAAAAAALAYGVDARAVARAVMGFRPLSHRLETVAEVEGVSYIDDSKATNPHATLAAVKGMSDVVLIAGGRAKGIDLAPLAQSVPAVVAVVVLGEASDDLVEIFRELVPIERATTMNDAVRRAHMLAGGKGSVLLSPGCASLDMYESYAERGEHFARAVRALIEDSSQDEEHRHGKS